MPEPTARNSTGLHAVYVVCTACGHARKLDLAALVEVGHGDIPLVKLWLRCTECGKFGHTISVGGRSSGRDAGPAGQA